MKALVKFFKYLALTLLILIFLLLGLLVSAFSDIKNTALAGLAAKEYLQEAATQSLARNFDEAKKSNEKASEKIDIALSSLENVKARPLFSKIKPLNHQLLDLEYLLKTASLISKSLTQALPLAAEFDTLYKTSNSSFAQMPLSQKQEFFRLIYESEPELNGLRANLELAKLNLENIKKIGVLYPIYSDISDLKAELDTAIHLLSQATPLIKLLPAFAGFPSQSNFLVIMHNNDELRPSGGFIGVFGLLSVLNGEISHLLTYDSYHLDMPAVGKWKMEPPAPIKKYMEVENWYLRDANWSPDWPTSARKIIEIYQGESQAVGQVSPDFTGVMGITPKFVSDLLALVGPISAGGEVYTPDNLQPLLQYSVEVAYKEQDIASWDRKQVINELLEELKIRLLNLDTEHLLDLLSIIEKNSLSKDLQIYFPNSAWQSLVYDLGASGEVKKTNSDYFLVVDANLAAFKSDAVLIKEIDYNLQPSSLQANLKLSYKHEGDFNWRTTRYRSYTRVYVPRGSKLESLQAHGQINLEAASISTYDDVLLDKTVFAFFFSLEPKNSGHLEINYTLPDRIKSDYSLLIQRQAGRRTERLGVTINNMYYPRQLEQDLIIKP
ncbi:MAG: DUF4012 domain-containing protein [Patescibacteria group bacterium]|nr:DUF4012 domain-containing protein [Patescibacteria group bacterium]